MDELTYKEKRKAFLKSYLGHWDEKPIKGTSKASREMKTGDTREKAESNPFRPEVRKNLLANHLDSSVYRTAITPN